LESTVTSSVKRPKIEVLLSFCVLVWN
jgi:hypothetical protein